MYLLFWRFHLVCHLNKLHFSAFVLCTMWSVKLLGREHKVLSIELLSREVLTYIDNVLSNSLGNIQTWSVFRIIVVKLGLS